MPLLAVKMEYLYLHKYIYMKMNSIVLMMFLTVAIFFRLGPVVAQQKAHNPVKAGMGASKPTGKMFILSDIHFDPFCYPQLVNQLMATDDKGWQSLFESVSNPSYGNYGSDTYYPLFKSTLEAMKAQNKKPDMIIINGDFLCHSFQNSFQNYTGIYSSDSVRKFIRKTTRFVLSMISHYFPNTLVLPVLGNNDSYCGDYQVAPQGEFLKFFGETIKPLLKKTENPGFDATFNKGGYFVATLPWDTTQQFIGLNTVFWSPKFSNSCQNGANMDAGAIEMSWLRATLTRSAAAHKKVWLSFHIPPGIDIYSSAYATTPGTVKGMWLQGYNDSFIALVNQFGGTIRACFGGHTHMDEFRLLGTDSTVNSFVHISPAVSPIFNNNPGFQELTWDPVKMSLVDNITWSFLGIETQGKNNWTPEYDYDKIYSVNAIDVPGLLKVWNHIGNNNLIRADYLKYYFVDNPNKMPSPWLAYWCGIRYMTATGFAKCNCGQN